MQVESLIPGHEPPGFDSVLGATTSCRLCGRPMRWLRTHNDRRAPVDAEPVTVTDEMIEEARRSEKVVRLLDRMGRNRPHVAGETGYVSHFATCPRADEARKLQAGDPLPPRPGRAAPSAIIDRLAYAVETIRRLKIAAGAQKAELAHLEKHLTRTKELIEEAT